jgi:cystathionine beta-lyase/cystathionine gamma-synthase
MRFSTRAIHAGDEPDDPTGSVVVPIYQVSTYKQAEPGSDAGYVYSRTANPTRTALERAVASLEEAEYGLAFASGLAAIATTTLSLLKSGDHIVAVEDLYGGTRRFFNRIMQNFRISTTYVRGTDAKEFEAAIRPETRIVWVETPTNPLLRIIDISAVAQTAHAHNALLVVDNTFMSPYLQHPLRLGADLIVHSTTKYLGGHSDLIGGAVTLSDRTLYDKVHFAQNAAGGVPGPMDCWLVLRGIKTLAVRMDRHCSNAQKVAEFLGQRKELSEVIYPGLRSHPQHELARRQMDSFGGMVSIRLKGGLDSAKRLLKGVKIFAPAESLGGVESLIEHPSSMTHASVPKEEREQIGITDSLIRVSVGLEDVDDLIADLSTALEHV